MADLYPLGDVFASFPILRKLLVLFGLLRGRNSSTFSMLRGIMLHLLFIDVSITFQFIYIFKLEDISELSNLLKMCLTYAALWVKSINFMWKFEEIAMLERSLEDLFKHGTCRWHFRIGELQPYVRRVRRIFNVLWVSSLLTIFFGAIALVHQRILPDKMWIPFNYDSDSRFYAIAFYQLLGACYSCTVNSIMDVLPISYMTMLTAVTNGMRRQIEGIVEHDDLKKAVEKYAEVKKCSERMREIFAPVIVVQAVCGSIILCTTAFSLSTMPFSTIYLRFFLYMLPMLMQIFIPCFYANELTSSSEKLSSALLHSEWLGRDKEFGSSVIIFMENLKNPIKWKVLRIFTVDVNNFVAICRFSYSVYALLESVSS